MLDGKSVRMFLVDGTPGGLITAEIMNWTGHVLAGPRTQLAALLKRSEVSNTGIYILLGDGPDGELGYIGEADEVAKRLQAHARPGESGGKDFWERAIVLTSKDANLTKAHARYLESRLIGLAREASRLELTNGTTPPLPPLPEADVSDMEFFISQVQIILPVLGANLLRGTKTVPQPHSSGEALVAQATSPVFELNYPKHGIVARAQVLGGEFTVFAGSGARAGWPQVKKHKGYLAVKSKLEADGTLVDEEGTSNLVFSHDQVFTSPSAAAAVIYARAANGRTKWRVEGSSQTFGEWQSQGVDLNAVDPAVDSSEAYENADDSEFDD